MNLNLILALLGAAGVYLIVSSLLTPRSIKLERPMEARGLRALQARLDAAELPVSAQEFLTACGGAALLSAAVALLLGAPALVVAGLTVVPALLWQRYESQRDKFRQAYDEGLAECVQLLREGFAATGALLTALDHTARNGPDPAAADFREVWSQYNVNVPLAQALANVAARRHNPYFNMVAEALSLKETQGGNISEILLGLETMVREQIALRREIAAKQAQARLESTIVSLAPVGFFLAMKVVPWLRAYENGFYQTLLGQIALTIAVIFSAVAFFLARRLATRGLTLEVKLVAP